MSKYYLFIGLVAGMLFLLVGGNAMAADAKSEGLGSAQLYFSASLVNDRVDRSVDQTQPVRENIMDTPITGTTNLVGTIQSSLVENQGAGLVRVLLKAHTTSTTTGTHWPVVIDDQSEGKIVGSIDILLNGLDFSTERDEAAADIHVINQQVQSETGGGWVLSIAEHKIQEEEPEANQEAESLAEGQIRTQLQAQVQEVLKKAKSQLNLNLIDPLAKSGIKPDHLTFETTKDWLILTAGWGKTEQGTPNWSERFEPSAKLVAVVPESAFIQVYNSLADRKISSVDDLEDDLRTVNLPVSWKQKRSLTLIKKEKRDGNLILQWGDGE